MSVFYIVNKMTCVVMGQLTYGYVGHGSRVRGHGSQHMTMVCSGMSQKRYWTRRSVAYLPTIGTNVCMLVSECNVQLVSVCASGRWSVKPRLTGADGDLMDAESV